MTLRYALVYLLAWLKVRGNKLQMADYLNKKGYPQRARSVFRQGLAENGWDQIRQQLQATTGQTISDDRIVFHGGAQNLGFITHNNKYISKIMADRDSFMRERYFYQHVIDHCDDDDPVLKPLYISDDKDPLMCITLPLVEGDDRQYLEVFDHVMQARSFLKKLADRLPGKTAALHVPKPALSKNMSDERFFRKIKLWQLFANIDQPDVKPHIEKLLAYANRLAEEKDLPQALKQDILHINRQLLEQGFIPADPARFCFTHGDLKSANFLGKPDEGILIDWGRASFLPVGYDLATMLSKAKLSHKEVEAVLAGYFEGLDAEQQLSLLACYLHCLKDIFSKDMPAAKKPERVAGFISYYRKKLEQSQGKTAVFGVFCLVSMLAVDI